MAVGAGLAGLEPLVGIPGSIGGALHGNAGGNGGDVGQWVERVTVMTHSGNVLDRETDDMQFAYRKSNIDELVILDAEFRLEPDDPEALTRRMQKLWILKRARQPAHNQCAGCVFQDPSGITAAELIERAGVKGAKVGNAEMSERHASFLIAHPGASSQDVLRLINVVHSRVLEKTGVALEKQIEVW
jgi:UDP-N-acetylmuramate dehydrogenase